MNRGNQIKTMQNQIVSTPGKSTAELISVIVPAYNAEKFIGRCIRSIQNQTYGNLEIIIVNDGSADGTKQICQRYCDLDSRIRLISQENQGVSAARNRGIDDSKGEYIAFVDADDTMPPKALEILLGSLLQGKADIVGGTMRAVYNDGTIKEKMTADPEIWKGEMALEKSLKDNPYTYSVWGKLFRKGFIGKTRFVEQRHIHEDSFFLFECFVNKPEMVCISECVYEYHILPDSASRTGFSEKYFDILYFAERKYKMIQMSYPQYEKAAQNMLVKANMALLKILVRATGKAIYAEEKSCIKNIKDNQKYFLPATEADKKWFFIIKYNLYYVYKLYYHLKQHAGL